MKKILFWMLLLPVMANAQQTNVQTTEYPNDYLSPAFHAGSRAGFKEKMPAKWVGIFFDSQVRLRNDDVDYQYAQNKNFYYFTGLEEPNAILLLFKEPTTILGKTGTEFIFVQNRDPQREMWNGKILGVEGVTKRYQFTNVFLNRDFKNNTIALNEYDSVLTSFRSEDIFQTYPRTRDELSRMAGIVDSLIKAHNKPIASRTQMQILTALRGIKQPEEIAIMEYAFKKNGSEYPGYPSINGSSENACVLHYVTNLRLMKDGDLLLSDCAAEYHGYTADVTRTVPVNGKFSPEQKIIYELVLAAQDSAIAACKPGMPFGGSDATARRVINRGLIQLGIAANEAEARRYFPHGTSHHLGLDVHDLGVRGNQPFEPGMYLTVEPGIYIPPNSKCDPKWWNIGVRIEDDILITRDGNRNLSAGAPRTVAEIEKLAKAKSIFN